MSPKDNRPKSKTGAIADFNGGYDLPSLPTTAEPGSDRKKQVMQTRAAHKRALHHPADPKLPWILSQDVADRLLEIFGGIP